MMGRFTKKKTTSADKSPKSVPRNPKGQQEPKDKAKLSNDDFGEDQIEPVAKGQAQQPIEVTDLEDLPKELLKAVKGCTSCCVHTLHTTHGHLHTIHHN